MRDRIKKLEKLKELKELELELINRELDSLIKNHYEKKLKKNNNENRCVQEKIENNIKKEEAELEEKIGEIKKDENSVVNRYVNDLMYELKNYPRYLKNGKNQIFHETGIEIPQFEKNGKMWVKLFNRKNEEEEVEVNSL